MIKRCQRCGKYTFSDSHCNQKTKEAGYKFIKIKSAEAKNLK